MNQTILQVGNRVHVSGYSPFRGLTGTVQSVQSVEMKAEYDGPLYFYLVKLEGERGREALWFLDDEVESISIREAEYASLNTGPFYMSA